MRMAALKTKPKLLALPQIALAMGVLTSNRRGVRTNFGGVDVGCHCWAPLLGAIAGCHCWVPLLGAIAGCHCWSDIAGCHHACHCWGAMAGVPWLDASYQLRRGSR